MATPDPVSADRTAELLLWFFQEPGRYHAEGRRRDAPLLDPEVVLKLALGRRVELAVQTQDGKAAAKLQAAAIMYVRHIFFRPDATPYQVLGLAPGAEAQAIKESFRLLMQLVHPDRQDSLEVWPDAFAAQANHAYGILRNQDARAKFDREAEARAAMARAMHRAAAASAASIMPVVQRPRPRLGGSGLLQRLTLPEWLTAGLGGYAREHPATVAFSILIGVAVLAIGTLGREGNEALLTREAHEGPARSASSNPAATAAVPDGTSSSVGRVQKPTPIVAESRQSVPAAPAASTLRSADTQPSKVPAPNSPSENGMPVPRVPPTVALATAAPVAKVEPPVGYALPSAGTGTGIASAPPEPASARAVASPAVVVQRPPVVVASSSTVAPSRPVAAASPSIVAPGSQVAVVSPPVAVVSPPVAPARAEPTAMTSTSAASALPPASTEIEALFATFVEAYERGRIDAFAALFDDEADANLRHGRAAIRGEYDEIFRLSLWRKMQLTRVNWKRVGDRTVAKGEITVRIGWRDGREVEQRLAVEMELVRRDGHAVIAKLSQRPTSP